MNSKIDGDGETARASGESETSRGVLNDVAVLIPVYNSPSRLVRTLESFEEFGAVHVLVVDDGSTPPAVPPHVPGLSITVLRLPLNVGIERALEAGIEELARRGFRFAARIDAGDRAVAGRLAKQKAFLAARPNVAAVGAWVEMVSADGRRRFSIRPPSAPDELRRKRFYRTPLVHPAVMLRVDVAREVGSYRQQFPAAEDLDLFLRLMGRFDCANLSEVGLYCELNDGGISSTKRRRQLLSTLQLIVRYGNPLNPYDWLGLFKTAAHAVIPYRALQRIKSALLCTRQSQSKAKNNVKS
ncbi:glycosyltransferase [Burkholderia sp. MR1-5-21]